MAKAWSKLRFSWADVPLSVLREQAAPLPAFNGTRNFSILALSGGGEHGAFGAGLLSGWSESGQRPIFNIVTGISPGARMAPLAFLGPAYDQRLKALYTQISFHSILSGNPFAGLFGEGFCNTRPSVPEGSGSTLRRDCTGKAAH
ncbi:MAG TPA: patatin-like phospholipase family protein [Chthoniobacterales bacterium]